MNNSEPRNSSEELLHIRAGECISCRIIGTGVLAGTGAYAIWSSRNAASGTPMQKRVLAGLGIALLIGSVFRWRNEPFVLRSIQS